MNFYTLWEQMENEKVNLESFYDGFLSSSNASREPLMYGTKEECIEIVNYLYSIDINELLDYLMTFNKDREYMANDVPCYSDFSHGIKRVNELVSFSNDGITFYDLGYQLVKSKNDNARTKYGENHAKLAQKFSLVFLSDTKPVVVTNTSIGNCLLRFPDEYRDKVLKILLLQDPFIQEMIFMAMNGNVSYREKVSFLTDKTALRRKANTKTLVEYIMGNTKYEACLKNIDWVI